MTQACKLCIYGSTGQCGYHAQPVPFVNARADTGECGPEARYLWIATWNQSEPAPLPTRWVYDKRKSKNAA